MKRKALILGILLSVSFAFSGCFGAVGRAFKPEGMVKHPDALMLIQEVKGNKVKVAVYDGENIQLVDYGWVEVEEGWTLSKYDWQAYIIGKRKELGIEEGK